MAQDETADKIFGDWCYCGQHLRAHSTGWCTVSNDQKVGLGINGYGDEAMKAAYRKCRALGLTLGTDQPSKS
jgi:hypothetical protein